MLTFHWTVPASSNVPRNANDYLDSWYLNPLYLAPRPAYNTYVLCRAAEVCISVCKKRPHTGPLWEIQQAGKTFLMHFPAYPARPLTRASFPPPPAPGKPTNEITVSPQVIGLLSCCMTGGSARPTDYKYRRYSGLQSAATAANPITLHDQ